MVNLENFPVSETGKAMLESVTEGWYERAYTGKWLYQIMGLSLDQVRELYNGLPSQFFIDTATWGLMYHEQKYGLPVRDKLTYEERRKLIYQRRDARTSMTPFAMERLLKNVTDFQVRIADINDETACISKTDHPNHFTVILMGDGTAAIQKIRELIDQRKQSHTTYGMLYYTHLPQEVSVRYENRIRFSTAFYPRFNLGFLYLDNTWTLDNSCELSGYDGSTYLDFYPVNMRISGGAGRCDCKAESGFCIRTGVLAAVKSAEWLCLGQEVKAPAAAEERLGLWSTAKQPVEEKEQMRMGAAIVAKIMPVGAFRLCSGASVMNERQEQLSIRTSAGLKLATASYMTRELYVDGSCNLDGSWRLDGGRYIL